MSSTFKIDNLITLTATFRDMNGALIDPTAITLKILQGGGSIQTFAYPATLTRLSIGVYQKEFDPPSAGNFTYQWKGTGTCEAMDEATFTITEAALG